jgi:predicted O-methyltransferase YrrM
MSLDPLEYMSITGYFHTGKGYPSSFSPSTSYGPKMRLIKKFLKRFQLVKDVQRAIHAPKAKRRGVALASIASFNLPANLEFRKNADAIAHIEGMFSPLSIAVMDMMLSFQESLSAKGDILEIGTYKGKSAALLGRHLKDGERLVLVDVTDYLDPIAVEPFKDRTDFILSDSSKLRRSLPRYGERHHTFRFIHIDASHGYEETFRELEMANELLAPLGIISLDDFTNLNYSQNIAAIFKYLYTAGSDFVMLLTTNEKGYVCRKSDFDHYADLVLRRSVAEMKSRDMDVVLARTSFGPEYKAFYLRGREPGEAGPFYGVEIYAPEIAGY